MSDLDSISTPYNLCKLKFVNTLTNHFADVINVFKTLEATPESIAAAEEMFLVNGYEYMGRSELSINILRYINYKKAAFKTSSKISATITISSSRCSNG